MRLNFAKIFLEAVRQRMEMAEMERGDLLAMFAAKLHGVVDRAVGGTPADEERVAFLVAEHFRDGQFLGELAEFVAALGGHGHVQLRAAGRVAHLVVLEAGHERVFAVENAGAGRDVLGDGVERVRLEGLRAVTGPVSDRSSGSADRVRRTLRCGWRARCRSE